MLVIGVLNLVIDYWKGGQRQRGLVDKGCTPTNKQSGVGEIRTGEHRKINAKKADAFLLTNTPYNKKEKWSGRDSNQRMLTGAY